jgi:hypothetical protein
MKTKWTVLSVLLLFATPAALQAQFGYTTNAGGASITITNYTGPSGAVTFPTNISGLTVTSIGNGAISVFANTGVTSVTIPNSVTSIGEFAFASSGLTSVTLGDSLTNIGPYGFEDCSGLTSVTIPSSVTTLDTGAFLGCAGLTNFTIPGSLANVGDYAFSFCTGLTSVTIANGVASIGNDAFNGCSSLTSVLIPGTVTDIGESPFNDCTLLTAIAVDSGNLFYSSVNGVLFDQSQATLIEYPEGQGGSYTIPLGVTSIGGAAFADSSLTNATIPSSVTNIGGAPFTGCALLTAIAVDSGNLFYSSVNGVLFDQSQTTLVEYPEGQGGSYTIPLGVTSIESNAFSECDNLTSVTIPESVTSIGESAFAGSGLTNVTIGNGVTSIGQGAFSGCTGLTSVTIPNSVTSIGLQGFFGCTNLTRVTIPGSVTNLGGGVFDDCSGLTNVIIGGGVTNLGNGAFAFCFSLASIYFEGNAPGVSSSAFRDDSATVYYLPGTIGWGSFSATTGLATVLWNARIQVSGGGFGVSDNQFGFNIIGTANIPIAVEACANLASPVWIPLQTLTLANGSFHFSEPFQTNLSGRYYRISSP